MKQHSILAVICLFVVFAACSTSSENPRETTNTRDRISPLGLGQPDPQRLAESALRAFQKKDSWAFLAHFAFRDEETGEFVVPSKRDGGSFSGMRAKELRGLAQTLFPLASWSFAKSRLGNPINVRNKPPTVQVPIHVEYDFSQMTTEEIQTLMVEVNHSLSQQGLASVSFEEYQAQLKALPADTSRIFIYLNKRWHFLGR